MADGMDDAYDVKVFACHACEAVRRRTEDMPPVYTRVTRTTTPQEV